MSRQDIYAKIWDDKLDSCIHSSSRRGKVEHINVDVFNDWNKEKVELDVYTSSKFKKNNLDYCHERIKHFTKLKNEKKIEFWAQRLAKWSIENADLENSEYVKCELKFPFDTDPLSLNINNVRLSKKEMTVIRLMQNKKWEELITYVSKNFNNNININDAILAEEI